MAHAQLVTDLQKGDEPGGICQAPLNRPSGHESTNCNKAVLRLLLCGHQFHSTCVKVMVENQGPRIRVPTYIQCPTCDTISGEKLGTQPDNGTMSYRVIPKGLPGFEKYHSIQITYNFNNGLQGPLHPNPGKQFFAIGFPRTCLLYTSDAADE